MEIARLRQQLVKLAGLTLSQGEPGQAAHHLGASLLAFEDSARTSTRTADNLLTSMVPGAGVGVGLVGGYGGSYGGGGGSRRTGSPGRGERERAGGGPQDFSENPQLALSGQGGPTLQKSKQKNSGQGNYSAMPTKLQPPGGLSPEPSLAALSTYTD